MRLVSVCKVHRIGTIAFNQMHHGTALLPVLARSFRFTRPTVDRKGPVASLRRPLCRSSTRRSQSFSSSHSPLTRSTISRNAATSRYADPWFTASPSVTFIVAMLFVPLAVPWLFKGYI